MPKLRLNLDALAVESFDAAPSTLGRATVHGRAFEVAGGVVVANTLVAADGHPCDPGTDTCPTNPTCPGQFTCDRSCGKVCTLPECPRPE
jgi:hypothetical protein